MIRIHYHHPEATPPIKTYFMDFENDEKEKAVKFSDGLTDRGFCTKEEIV